MKSIFESLRQHEAARLVNSQRHTSAPLTVWNYSAKCQYDHAWDDALMSARGLILDDQGNVAARGFRKFFNLSQCVDPLPPTSFKVLDKLDGSLGILYFADGEPAISTRGSFVSDQAKRATAIFKERYSGYRPPDGTTAVFEIIYPSNRIVVDYGKTEDIFHLALVDNATGLARFDLDPAWPGPITREFEPCPPSELVKQMRPNAEGFVVRYACGFQVKVKLEEYVRIHRSMFQTSTRSIWERLAAGETEEQIYANMPDEVMPFVREHVGKLQSAFRQIEGRYKSAFSYAEPFAMEGRRAFASEAMAWDYPSILFAMLDRKPYASIIWKSIEPEWIPAKAMVAESVA